MTLTVVVEDGVSAVEAAPGEPLMNGVADVDRIIEACMSERLQTVLLHAEHLPPAFFDLSSGQAGAILQKLRNYGVRLAVVCPPGSARFSRRFGEMAAEERGRPHFGVFTTRAEARAWIAAQRA
jgi:hypothetical protein